METKTKKNKKNHEVLRVMDNKNWKVKEDKKF